MKQKIAKKQNRSRLINTVSRLVVAIGEEDGGLGKILEGGKS